MQMVNIKCSHKNSMAMNMDVCKHFILHHAIHIWNLEILDPLKLTNAENIKKSILLNVNVTVLFRDLNSTDVLTLCSHFMGLNSMLVCSSPTRLLCAEFISCRIHIS
jgi:hypothetical protein